MSAEKKYQLALYCLFYIKLILHKLPKFLFTHA